MKNSMTAEACQLFESIMHLIRSPLSLISTSNELLLDDSTTLNDTKKEKLLKQSSRSTARLLRIVKSLQTVLTQQSSTLSPSIFFNSSTTALIEQLYELSEFTDLNFIKLSSENSVPCNLKATPVNLLSITALILSLLYYDQPSGNVRLESKEDGSLLIFSDCHTNDLIGGIEKVDLLNNSKGYRSITELETSLLKTLLAQNGLELSLVDSTAAITLHLSSGKQ